VRVRTSRQIERQILQKRWFTVIFPDFSQGLFPHRRRTKHGACAGSSLTAASLLIALATGSSPAWAQTPSGSAAAPAIATGSGLPDNPATPNAHAGTTASSRPYKLSLLAAADSPASLPGTPSATAENDWGTQPFTRAAALYQAQAQPQTSEPATSSPAPGSLTWHGITLYGAYDIGLGWVSHGLPENGYNYEGASLINRNGYQHRFLIAPNNLQQTGFGVRGKIEFQPGWFAVFNGSTGLNPQSGLLANASKTDIVNNGLPRTSYSYAIDGTRAGQPFNDEYYGGISSDQYGTLTFGRQRSLGTDIMLLYDPAGGSYQFSYIGYNGTMAGGGDTEDSRWDSAVKYRVTYGPYHLAAMYKFADGNGGCFSASAGWTAANCTPETAHNNAYAGDIGSTFHKFSGDLVYQHYNQAISVLNPLLGPQSVAAPYQSTTNSINTNQISGANLIPTADTLYGIVTDNNAFLATAKYTREQFKVFGGFEYIWQNNPHDPLGVAASDQGGYFLSGVEDNNLDTEKILRIWWIGVKYAYDQKTDITFAWYEQLQNDFRSPQTCSPTAGYRASCPGALNEGSVYADHHFTKRFDGFAGLTYSFVYGGMAIAIPHGPGVPYLHNSNFAPAIGGRFAF
jgi:predicted porin